MAEIKPMDDSSEASECFRLRFLCMGQGDCTMIRCPDGKVVVIDCGSKASLDEADYKPERDMLREANWAGTSGRVHALILTHPDFDHYNEVYKFFWGVIKGETSIIAENVYFSVKGSPGQGALARYKTGGVNGFIYGSIGANQLVEVTINSANNNFKTVWVKDDKFKKASDPITIPGRKLVVCHDTTKNGKKWEIAIIAGNVARSNDLKLKGDDGQLLKDSGDETNASSLVTRISIDDKVALIVGDATFSTEQFLIDNHAGSIAEVSLVQAGHHGSSETSSSPAYVKLVKPTEVVVSCGFIEHTHHLPRYVALARWLGSLPENKKEPTHPVDYWRDEEEAGVTMKELREAWQKQGKEIQWGSAHRLAGKPPSNQYFACHRKMLLYRQATTKFLWQTSEGPIETPLG